MQYFASAGVTSSPLRVGLYRFRATLGDRWASYLSLALLIAILGGVAMGTVAGARKTETSFTTLLNEHKTSNLFGAVQVYNPQAGYHSGYSATAIEKVRRLAHVEGVSAIVGLNAFPLGSHGQTLPGDDGFSPEGSVDGLELNQDRLIITKGRLPNPRRADEFVADAGTVQQFGWHLGEVVTFGYYTNKSGVAAGLKHPKIAGHFRARLVGTGAVQPTDLVQDQVDDVPNSGVLFTPALTRQYLTCCANDTFIGFQLKGGNRFDTQVTTEYQRLFPKIGIPLQSELAAEDRVARSVRPEALALGIFGVLTALAAIAIALQLSAGIARRNANDATILRSMGADPRTTITDSLIGAFVAIVTGAIAALVVAIAISPLAPIGPIRPYLGAHVSVDWTVLGPGTALFVTVLGVITALFARQHQPHRERKREQFRARSNLAPTLIAGRFGMPVAVVTGVGFALESGGNGRRAVPMRSAIVGAALALIIVGATTTFATSLRTLVSSPPLYGWNWSAALNGGGGVGDLPKAVDAPLAKDRDIATMSKVYFASLRIDGEPVPVMGETPASPIQPPLLSGHDLESAGQVVLGASTMALLHKEVGDTVVVSTGRSKPTELRIVGTATMPAFGQSGSDHLEMGIGAVLNYTLIPLAERDIFDLPPGPNAILVRYRHGVSATQGEASIFHAVKVASGAVGSVAPAGLIDTVERPAEIVNYRSLGSTPIELGAVLAGGALVGLGLTLLSSVRRRRRDIALLKALGFTRRQIVATVAVQSTVAVGLGAITGLTVGIVVGRVLWTLFASSIHALPRVVVPTPTLLVIAVVSLGLANLVAVVPARLAARTSPAILLRSE